jgi:hypothetical protein
VSAQEGTRPVSTDTPGANRTRRVSAGAGRRRGGGGLAGLAHTDGQPHDVLMTNGAAQLLPAASRRWEQAVGSLGTAA